jgi:hypothetical protein
MNMAVTPCTTEAPRSVIARDASSGPSSARLVNRAASAGPVSLKKAISVKAGTCSAKNQSPMRFKRRR